MATTNIVYASGMLKSVKLVTLIPENPADIHVPTLEFHANINTLVLGKAAGSNPVHLPSYSTVRSFIVPLHTLENIKQCEDWIKLKLLSMRIVVVDSEIRNMKEMLVGLVWKLKDKVEGGEACLGVVEIDIVRIVERLMDFRSKVVKQWTDVNERKFKGGRESCTCAICLDEMDEKSTVVEMPCCHEFHSKCIGEWLVRNTACPCCRRRACIKFTFKMEKITNT